MTIDALIAVFESAVCLVLLLVLILRLVPSLRLDIFRQRMFEVRDELFDYAAAGHIEFNNPAYRLLRQSMNGFIRYAHQLTFFRLCLTILRWRMESQQPEMTWSIKWENALSSISDVETRRALQEFHHRSMGLVVERLTLGSPVLITVLALFFIVEMIHSRIINVKQVCSELMTSRMSKIVEFPILEEEAARA